MFSRTLLSQACLPQSYCTVKLSCSCCKRAKIPHAYPKQNTSIGNHLHAWKKERNIWKTLSKILWHLPLQTKNDTSPRSTDDSFSLEFAVPSCFMNWKSFRACILWERQWKRIWTQGNILTCHFSTLGVHSVNSFREISYSFFFHRLLVRAKKLFPLLHNLQSDVWKSESSLDLSVLDICVRMLIFGTETIQSRKMHTLQYFVAVVVRRVENEPGMISIMSIELYANGWPT